jgi:hypothetical protein
MSRKRSAGEMADVVDALVGLGGVPKAGKKTRRPLTEAQKARARERARDRRVEARMAQYPAAEAMFSAYPYKKGSRAKDLNKAGPYARSIATYRPLKNDWPGVDDIGVDGKGARRFHVGRKGLAALYASGARQKRAPTQRQLEALARGREIRAGRM